MASIYKPVQTRPLPEGATVCVVRGKAHARVSTRSGSKLYELTADGKGVRVPRKCWYVQYHDAEGRRKTVKAFRDKEASRELARKIQREVDRRKSGLASSDPGRGTTPYAEAVAAYCDDLARRGRVSRYVRVCRQRLLVLGRECPWATVGRVGSQGLTRWLSAQSGKAPSTMNQWVETAKSFCQWLVRQRWLEANPLAGVEKGDESLKFVVRRSLTEGEAQRLLDSVPLYRKRVYQFAMLTGLRRSEIGALVWDDVRFDGQPRAELRASTTKSKRADVVVLPDGLAAWMKEAQGPPGAPVFGRVPELATLRRDLKRAGIPQTDQRGRRVDFHALRHTFGSWLAKAGVPVKTAMEMMRHTDVRLTMQVYADASVLDFRDAASRLPKLKGA